MGAHPVGPPEEQWTPKGNVNARGDDASALSDSRIGCNTAKRGKHGATS